MSNPAPMFKDEKEFEDAIIARLEDKGWDSKEWPILKYPDEKTLRENFARIVFNNNQQRERLNGVPLDEDEINQLINQFQGKSPYAINGLLLGGSLTIKRTNKEDKLNYGKTIGLDIFFPKQIGEGNTVYQIARQPKFSKEVKEDSVRRGDFMLLISGLPIIHVELKASGHNVQEGINQIETYIKLNRFTGIFSTVQLFVSMTPEESRYFSHPGDLKGPTPNDQINRKFTFSWADQNNEKKDDWQTMCEEFLAIPEAHKMVAYYTIADRSKSILKVMRSYQCYAARKIRDTCAELRQSTFLGDTRPGGYIWHTTGSGKTMTSFKSAQLIADANFAEKVLFVLDRVELGDQSTDEFNNFGGELGDTVYFTEDTEALAKALVSDRMDQRLIVTSIQKLDLLVSSNGSAKLLEKLKEKKFVFIFDECHRSTFGDSFPRIRDCFVSSIFFGFTGTPIKEQNKKLDKTTSYLFGSELHRYSLADGIRDGNVLAFNCTMVKTVNDDALREKVALRAAGAKTAQEARSDERKKAIYQHYMNPKEVTLLDLERKISESDYGEGHRRHVIEDILENFDTVSCGKQFHALLATQSIPEAIAYYDLLKEIVTEKGVDLRFTAVFDPNLDFKQGRNAEKSEAVKRIMQDYNNRYETGFDEWTDFKDDVIRRLSHKRNKSTWIIGPDSKDRLDLVIVVNQLLTGFDSLYLNTLFVDKTLETANLIQAFSRTNRILNEDKQFGQIRYYRYPHTTRKNIKEAVKLYSGEDPVDIFVPNLSKHIEHMDRLFAEISELFTDQKVPDPDFSQIPTEDASQRKFSRLFYQLTITIKAAKLQGFDWKREKLEEFHPETGERIKVANPNITEELYNRLAKRYSELKHKVGTKLDIPLLDLPFITNPQTSELIDKEFINEKFKKFLLDIGQKHISKEEYEEFCNNFHRSFASLKVGEQNYAEVVFSLIRDGKIQVKPDTDFMALVYDFMVTHEEKMIRDFADAFGFDVSQLKTLVNNYSPSENINRLGNFENLLKTADMAKVAEFITQKSKQKIPAWKYKFYLSNLLETFIKQKGKFGIDQISIDGDNISVSEISQEGIKETLVSDDKLLGSITP